jgi:hypothetical protein
VSRVEKAERHAAAKIDTLPVRHFLHQIHHHRHIARHIQRPNRLLIGRDGSLIQIPRVFFLDLGRIGKNNVRHRRARRRAINRPGIPRPRQHRNFSAMIEVPMRENHRIDRFSPVGQPLIQPPRLLARPLIHSHVQKQPQPVDFD